MFILCIVCIFKFGTKKNDTWNRHRTEQQKILFASVWCHKNGVFVHSSILYTTYTMCEVRTQKFIIYNIIVYLTLFVRKLFLFFCWLHSETIILGLFLHFFPLKIDSHRMLACHWQIYRNNIVCAREKFKHGQHRCKIIYSDNNEVEKLRILNLIEEEKTQRDEILHSSELLLLFLN